MKKKQYRNFNQNKGSCGPADAKELVRSDVEAVEGEQHEPEAHRTVRRTVGRVLSGARAHPGRLLRVARFRGEVRGHGVHMAGLLQVCF